MKKLSITADDFGAHPDIDKGIIDCIEAGSTDNVDCLVNNTITSGKYDGYNSLSAIEDLVSRFKARIENKDLSLGLHLTLTSGKPVSKEANNSRLLKDDYGQFRKIHKHNYRKLNTRKRQDLIRAELDAQLGKLVEVIPGGPDHVSFHAGIGHLTKKLSETYFTFCSDNRLPVRNPLLISRLDDSKVQPDAPTKAFEYDSMMVKVAKSDGLKILRWNTIGDVMALGGALSGKQIYSILEEHKAGGGLTTDYFIDNFYCKGMDTFLRYLLESLFDASFEMVVHPVHPDVLNHKGSVPSGIKAHHLDDRVTEWEVLSNPDGKINSLLKKLHKNDFDRFRMISSHLQQAN